jgi:hypothetical protein
MSFPGDIMACYGGGQSAKNECLSAYGLVERRTPIVSLVVVSFNTDKDYTYSG